MGRNASAAHSRKLALRESTSAADCSTRSTLLTSEAQVCALGGGEPTEGLTLFGMLGLMHQWLYLPMGMAGLAVSGSISGALPHRIWPAILRSFPDYGVVFMVFAALALLNDFAGALMSWVPILGSIVAVTLSIYILMVQSRFTATMYLNLQKKIKF